MNSQIPHPVSGVKLEILDDETLLYHPSLTKAIYLNPTATIVWRLIDGERSIDEITEILKSSFPNGTENISSDVLSVLESLEGQGAITLK